MIPAEFVVCNRQGIVIRLLEQHTRTSLAYCVISEPLMFVTVKVAFLSPPQCYQAVSSVLTQQISRLNTLENCSYHIRDT